MSELVTVKTWESMDRGNSSVVEYGDIKFVVKHTIPYDDAAYIVDFVSGVVLSEEDGVYRPEAKESLIRSKILEMYANFRMPRSFEKTYYLVHQTDAYDLVYGHVNKDQVDCIRMAIDEKLDYRLRVSADGFKRELNSLTNTMSEMNEKYEGVFSDMSAEDMSNFVKNMSVMTDDVSEKMIANIINDYKEE